MNEIPRSKNNKVAEILEIIKNDRDLRSRFLELLVFALERDYGSGKRELVDIINRELANRLRGF